MGLKCSLGKCRLAHGVILERIAPLSLLGSEESHLLVLILRGPEQSIVLWGIADAALSKKSCLEKCSP